ncbi:hypothetical protein, partial [Xanthovirga aplysinae]|uniref:hypothetical protein n=1 Tax=Xanthovirga aplysinae TaxID=2529853 RepID=UPI0012BCC497
MKRILSLLFLCIINYSHAQLISDVIDPSFLNTALRYENFDQTIKGSPFFVEEWLPGKVEFEDGAKYEKLKLKYDLYRGDLLYEDKTKGALVLDKNMVREFSLIDPLKKETYVFEVISIPSKRGKSFGERLLKGVHIS